MTNKITANKLFVSDWIPTKDKMSLELYLTAFDTKVGIAKNESDINTIVCSYLGDLKGPEILLSKNIHEENVLHDIQIAWESSMNELLDLLFKNLIN